MQSALKACQVCGPCGVFPAFATKNDRRDIWRYCDIPYKRSGTRAGPNKSSNKEITIENATERLLNRNANMESYII